MVSKKSTLSISPAYFTLGDGIFSGVLSIGLPASITNVLMSLSNIVLNKQLVTYGDIPVAAMGIAMKANMLVVFVQMGIAMGVQPLIGYNYGAKNYKRMKAALKFSLFVDVMAGLLLTTVYYIFTRDIISVFMKNNVQVIDAGVMMLRALMVAGPVLGVLFILNFAFQAMGKALPSLALAVSRQGFIFLPLVFILNGMFGLNGIIFAQPIADYASITMAVIMFLVMTRKLK